MKCVVFGYSGCAQIAGQGGLVLFEVALEQVGFRSVEPAVDRHFFLELEGRFTVVIGCRGVCACGYPYLISFGCGGQGRVQVAVRRGPGCPVPGLSGLAVDEQGGSAGMTGREGYAEDEGGEETFILHNMRYLDGATAFVNGVGVCGRAACYVSRRERPLISPKQPASIMSPPGAGNSTSKPSNMARRGPSTYVGLNPSASLGRSSVRHP